MVKGISIFRNYFEGYEQNYIITGGTACDIIIEDAGFSPRATKDIDIILVVEALNPAFASQFWKFIAEGQYEKTEQNQSDRKYYRFMKPANPDFPFQVELFSRKPDLLRPAAEMRLTPIPVGEDISSLSAILMNDEYYRFTLDNCSLDKGLHHANTEALICLKAKAYLDMIERKEKGEHIDDRSIRKHKGDVFRLGVTLSSNRAITLPTGIQTDMELFFQKVSGELPEKNMFKELGLPNFDSKKLYQQMLVNFKL